jgi:peroxiredoxin
MPFPFLIDQNREVIKAFDVYNPINFDAFRIAHPSLFLISPAGEIIYRMWGKIKKIDRVKMRPINKYTGYCQIH